ncbi:MAG: helix-turn-helix transcriptional regulator [Bacteroidales bacterium]|nr:helix-turn-helix transcriptional regulator [Bacteroidales bacterium]
MHLLYDFNVDTADDLAVRLSENVKRRRLEKGLSRSALSMMSGVPAPTIAKFEQHHSISLIGFLALAKALGYTDALKSLLTEPVYTTMEELDTINKNKNRKRGRNEFNR